MQGLHDRFTHCERAVQGLHSPATHCEKATQVLHGRFTHCERAVQVLHDHAAHCEKAAQALHGRFTHCDNAVQVLHTHFAHCERAAKRCMIVSHTLPAPRRCCTFISLTVTAYARGERNLSEWLPNGFAAFGRSFEAGCISLSMHPLTDIQYEYTNSNHLSFDGRLHDDVGPARGAREVCVHL